jgi:hypothetical protein
LDEINNESKIINSLCDEWGVEKSQILNTANRFFTDYKKFGSRIKKLDQTVVDYQMKFVLSSGLFQVGFHHSDQENPSIYCSFVNNYAEELSNKKKGIVFYNENFIYGLIGSQDLLKEEEFKQFLETTKKQGHEMKYKSQNQVSVGKKKVQNVYQFMIIYDFNPEQLLNFFKSKNFGQI